MIFESPFKTAIIYVFSIDDAEHEGCLKVGQTEAGSCNVPLDAKPNSYELNECAKARINQYTRTAAIKYNLLYTEQTLYKTKEGYIASFTDTEVHKVLLRSDKKKKKFDNGANEWFITDLKTVIAAIKAVKEGRTSIGAKDIGEIPETIELRPEQRDAVEKTTKVFKKGGKHMLWDAKMRFGKTVSALQLIKEMGFVRTLILTHRPVVDESWFKDFGLIFSATDYEYGSRQKGEVDQEKLEERSQRGECKYIYFASMQDLRGSELVGGKFDKNNSIFSTDWDLLIVDEAHEGTRTELGQSVLAELTKGKTRRLMLSGTPFNLLDEFEEKETFTWDYVMEQRAKKAWDELHPGDPNPYRGLARMNIYTYDLGHLLTDFEDEEVAFNFREFFRTTGDDDNMRFLHEKDVRAFLDVMTKEDKESYYPFANQEYRDMFRHTLWIVPGVKAARVLSKMLSLHPVFMNYTIVNVAGEGGIYGEGEECDNALEMVENAIGKTPENTRTITISCGKLTTGVSVPEWTAVMMLSGSFNTAASSYMQTIFRVQTPAVIGGKMKTDCYVFDFAPDRTLKVFAEVATKSGKATRAGKTTEEDRRALGEFINFCPIISVEGGKMVEYDADHLVGQLKKTYVERVVRKGFEDNYLYNDNLMKLGELELKEFEDLGAIIGKSNELTKPQNIDINKQGLTDEQYNEISELEKKKKKELTEEEKKRLEELRKKLKKRSDAISVLRNISIRMPLIIYGADLKNEEEEITIDNFTSLIDPQSWEEFMPRGVTKQIFNNFKKYYDPDIFREAGKKIRALARAVDNSTVEERIERITNIFQTFKNPDKETVLTPWRVVNMHLSEALGGYCFYNEEFTEPISEPRYVDRGWLTVETLGANARVLEINSKSGLYPLYVAYTIYRAAVRSRLISTEEVVEQQMVWDDVVRRSLFVVCKTPMAVSITRRTLVGFRDAKVNAKYVPDLIEKIKTNPDDLVCNILNGKGFWKLNNENSMKFDAVVGNPPYQEEGLNTRKAPIYHLFYDLAFRLSDRVTLITPARFLFGAGQTPKEWTDKIIEDKHFKVVKYFKESIDVFPSVDIKGGVVMTYRDASAVIGPIGFFSKYEELRTIMEKVSSHKDFVKKEFSELVSSQGLYKFSETAFEEHSEIYEVQGKGTAAKITSKVFEQTPKLFLEEEPANHDNFIRMLGLSKKQRVYKWIEKRYILPTEGYNESYNVFVAKANGIGAFGEVLSTPEIIEPGVGHTDTFQSIGKFDNAQQVKNCLKYIKTKFCRCMLGTLKATQDNPRDTWSNIPLQDFSANSDINWEVSIAEIDKQLYEKYGLTEEEKEFIEEKVRAME